MKVKYCSDKDLYNQTIQNQETVDLDILVSCGCKIMQPIRTVSRHPMRMRKKN